MIVQDLVCEYFIETIEIHSVGVSKETCIPITYVIMTISATTTHKHMARSEKKEGHLDATEFEYCYALLALQQIVLELLIVS